MRRPALAAPPRAEYAARPLPPCFAGAAGPDPDLRLTRGLRGVTDRACTVVPSTDPVVVAAPDPVASAMLAAERVHLVRAR